MTNERAIEHLHRLQDEQFDGIHGDERREALEMAVRALEGDGDMISRKAVMKEFSDFVRKSNNSDFAPTPTWNDAVSLVGSMPSAQPHWIPCSERLPEENDDYWVTADPRYVPQNYKSTDLVSWHEGKWLMADYFVLDGEKRKMPTYKVMEVNVPIIAWMPLPEPYGGESDD